MLIIFDYAEYFGNFIFREEVRYLIADLEELVGHFFALHLVVCLD
jgi:hypothetical protein